MEVEMKEFEESQLPQMVEIWNDIIQEGVSFPGDQASTVCAVLNGTVVGVYILHPNNFGRCGHIANASYAVRQGCRGKGIGRKMVKHCLENAKAKGFRGLQFNAVVATNQAAMHLYESLGFEKIGKIKGGYRLKDGSYEDIYSYFYDLSE